MNESWKNARLRMYFRDVDLTEQERMTIGTMADIFTEIGIDEIISAFAKKCKKEMENILTKESE